MALKTICLIAFFSGVVIAQVGNGCTGMYNQNQPPPDYGNWGTCGPDQNDGSTCSISCDNLGPGYVWNVAGPAYTCNNGNWGGGPQSCQYADYHYGAKNCTFPPWNFYQNTWSMCTSQCGGTQTQTRTAYQNADPGGEPCPAMSWDMYCGQNYCTDTMITQGYYYWGPFCASSTAPRTVNYRIVTDQTVDLYVFDTADFTRYTWDASLPTPLNAYYYPEYAYLNTNYYVSSFTVPAGECYYYVVDNTNVGPTQTQTNQNGQPSTFNIHYSFKNINMNDGFTDFSTQTGWFQAGSASHLSLSFFGLFLTVLVVLVL